MAVVRPFRGLRYAPEQTPDIGAVLAPPYDVLDEAARQALLARDLHNMALLTLGRHPLTAAVPEQRYAEAADDLRSWLTAGILAADPEPSLYVYEQTFRLPGENWLPRRVRRGLLAAVKLERYEAGIIHPHEHTMRGPKADRLRLMEACRASLGPVMAMYGDAEQRAERLLAGLDPHAALWEVETEGDVMHRFWRLTAPKQLAAIAAAFADTELVIADGHHRYETALAYRDEMRRVHGVLSDAPWEYALMFLGNVESGGMTVLPCHRLLRRVPGDDVPAAVERLEAVCTRFALPLTGTDGAVRLAVHDAVRRMVSASPDRPAFGAYWGRGRGALLTLKQGVDEQPALASLSPDYRRLGVVVLHRVLLEGALGCTGELAEAGQNVFFTQDGLELVRRVDAGEAQLGFLLPPTPVDQVVHLAAAGERLPHKATFFYPKLLTGTVLLDLRPAATIA